MHTHTNTTHVQFPLRFYTRLFFGAILTVTLLASHSAEAVGPQRSTVDLLDFRFGVPTQTTALAETTTQPDEPAAETEETAPDPTPRFSTHYTLTSYTSLAALTDSSPFITANGSHVHMGTVAANCLPFGTQLKIPDMFGDQIFTVEDRLNARKGCGIIDVWLPTYAEAKQFGVKFKIVEVF